MTYTTTATLEEFTGLSRLSSQDLSLKPQQAGEPKEEAFYTPCGYVDLEELHECLELYYSHQLDEVTDLTRLYLSLDQLIAGKSLISQLTSEDIEQALIQISFKDHVYLEGYFIFDLKDTTEYAGALIRFSEVIYAML